MARGRLDIALGGELRQQHDVSPWLKVVWHMARPFM